MRQTSFLIISESYIYKTGLRFLLKELENSGNVYLSDDVSQIRKSYSEYLFIDPDITSPEEIKRQILSLPEGNRPVLIALIHCRKDGNPLGLGPFRFALDMSLPKSEIFRSLQEITRDITKTEKHSNREERLSEREKMVLRYVALGYTNKEIAGKLFISMHTVITHRKNITRKLGIKTVSGLTVYAILNQLIDMGDMK